MGHGHVIPNPDGSKARCGGPALCAECARERAAMIHYSGQHLVVGQYTIRPAHRGGYWIEHESGEGMQCSADSFEALITQFYADNF